MGELHRRLRQVHPDLTWQVGKPLNGQREFAISADGILAAFSAVESVADAAPPLKRWKIVRFRPREEAYYEGGVQMDGVKVNGSDIECSLCSVVAKDGGRKIGVEVFVRGCPEKNHPSFRRIAYIMLDSALGEYDVECKVGYIGVFPFEHRPSVGSRVPFAEFRAEFDRAFDEHFTAGD